MEWGGGGMRWDPGASTGWSFASNDECDIYSKCTGKPGEGYMREKKKRILLTLQVYSVNIMMIVVLTVRMQLPVITSCVLAVMRTPLLCVWLEVQRYLMQT